MDQGDQALIERCLGGDVAAFEPLVEKYRQRVWRIAYQIVRDREEAWDVSQEAFIRAYQSLAAFRGQSAFYTWLFRIVVNLATDRIRQRAARGRAFGTERVSESEWEGALPDESTAGPEEEAARRESRQRIARALDALPSNFRTIIMLSDVEGLSYREIAEVLNIPIGTVMSRLHNARKRFRVLLKPLLFMVLGLLPAWSAPPAYAQQAVSFGARILLATEALGSPSLPPPADEQLQRVLVRLRGLFRYNAYIPLERYRADVPIGTMQRWVIAGDRRLDVMPQSVVNSAVRMWLRLAHGNLVELNANIEAQPDRWAVIGGPRYNDGVLIIVIWAHPNPG